MRNIRLGDAAVEFESLSEDERRALRGSRFAPLPAPVSRETAVEPRIPHPGGPVATNKAAALAKFLQRKLETSSGSLGLDPALVEAAVENAKATLHGLSASAVKVRHVETFSDSDKEIEVEEVLEAKTAQVKSKKKKRKKGKKNAWKQVVKSGDSVCKGPLKKPKH